MNTTGEYPHTDGDAVCTIDPGLTGAIAVQYSDGTIALSDMPVIADRTGGKKSLDVNGLLRMLPAGATVHVERQQAMPKQGLSSTFQTGLNYGRILGLLSAMSMRHSIFSPVTWAKAVGKPAKTGKDWNVAEARRRYPEFIDQLLKSKDGRADALLMLAYVTEQSAPERPVEETKPTEVVLPDW